MLLPCLLFQEEPSIDLTIKGGTLVGMSPTYHSFNFVLLPILRTMGIKAEYQVVKHGFFPDLVGETLLKVNSLGSEENNSILGLDLSSRGGDLLGIQFYVDVLQGKLWDFY